MNLFYPIAYRLGFAPWERAAAHPAAADQIRSLFAREEQGREPPFGRALDLGCGRGHWAVTLAQRGWQVTGVELVRGAVRAARERARTAGVDLEIVQGDVTALQDLGLGSGFRLVWDFGTLHGLNSAQWRTVGQAVDRLAASDARVLTLVWAPARRGPLPRGASRAEIETAFPGWRVSDEAPFDVSGLPAPLRKVNPRVYRLRRV